MNSRIRHIVSRGLALAVFIAATTSLPLFSQTANSPGSINGEVSDEGTKALLEGASVTILGINRNATTDSSGNYALIGIPAGDYEVVVSYPGLDTVTQKVTISAGQWARVNFALTSSDIVRMEAFQVVGEREGSASTIIQQQKSDNVVNIVSVDAYGNVADGNIGSFLQRLPGVAVLSDDGEISGITLRGAPPNMSMVSLDGTRMAAASVGAGDAIRGDRAPNISRIPSELIKQIEVYKALTPDQDADAIGGSANLVTRSAFDFRERYINYRAAYTLNTYRDGNPWKPYYTLTLMDTFFGRKLGVALVGSYNETINARDRVQMQHRYSDDVTDRVRFLDDYTEREKIGLSLKLEYRFNPTASVFASAVYTDAKSDTVRNSSLIDSSGQNRVADYSYTSGTTTYTYEKIASGEVSPRVVLPGATSASAAGIAPGHSETFTELLNPRLFNQPSYFNNKSKQYDYALGGKKTLGYLEVTAKGTYSKADTDNLGRVATFRREQSSSYPAGSHFGYAIDTSGGADNPRVWQTYGSTIYAGSDSDKYKMEFQLQPQQAEEKMYTGQFDLKSSMDHWRLPLELKAGGKFRRQDRVSQTNQPRWNYTGPDGRQNTNDDNLGQFFSGPGYGVFNGKYPLFDLVDMDAIHNLYNSNPDCFVDVGTATDIRGKPATEITEDVYAGYFMARLNPWRNVTLIGGIRMESTKIDATGVVVDSAEINKFETTTKKGSYDKWFPSAHLRYEPVKGLMLRAAYTTTMARPAIANIVPDTTVTMGDGDEGTVGTVRQNNTGLKAQFSKNYDLMIEYYFKPVGLISAGVFRKDISDFISLRRIIIDEGEYAGFTLITHENLTSARIEGYELNYYQQLRFLPGILQGLSVFANYTHIKTHGTYDDGNTELANFIPETINAGLSWTYGRINARVSYNYKSGYLSSYSTEARLATRYESIGTWDASLSYTIKRSWLTFSVNVVNIGNDWPSAYAINPNALDIIESYGTRITVGFNGRF